MTPSKGDLRINSMSAAEGSTDTIASAATRAHDPTRTSNSVNVASD